MAESVKSELRNDEMNKASVVKHFQLFPKRPLYAEQTMRLGLVLATFQLSCNLGIPFLCSAAWFYKNFSFFGRMDNSPSPKVASYVKEIGWGNKLKLGVDAYLGELALILPLFKLWLKFEPLGRPFKERRLFSFFYLLFKFSIYELMVNIRLMGICISLHLPFYELPMVGRQRQKANQQFWKYYQGKFKARESKQKPIKKPL